MLFFFFEKYGRATAFMEVFKRYTPEGRSVYLQLRNGGGTIYADYDVVEEFCRCNPGMKYKEVV